MRSVLAVFIAATFAAGVAVVVDDARQRRAPVVVEVEERTVEVLPPGQAEVTGTVQRAHAERAVTGPLPLPLTFTAAPGQAAATVEAAIVDGDRATIVWDGGRPLRLTGGGGLELGPTEVDIAPDGITWPLDGDPRGLLPGTYAVAAPVAVGRGGLASPADEVTFEADERTALVTRGGLAVRTPPRPLRLEGPGLLRLDGALTVRTADGTDTVPSLDFGPGPYVVDLVPTGAGWRVEATVRGPRR